MRAVQLNKPTYRGGNFNAIKATKISRALFACADLLVAVVVVVAAAPSSSKCRSRVYESSQNEPYVVTCQLSIYQGKRCLPYAPHGFGHLPVRSARLVTALHPVFERCSLPPQGNECCESWEVAPHRLRVIRGGCYVEEQSSFSTATCIHVCNSINMSGPQR